MYVLKGTELDYTQTSNPCTETRVGMQPACTTGNEDVK